METDLIAEWWSRDSGAIDHVLLFQPMMDAALPLCHFTHGWRGVHLNSFITRANIDADRLHRIAWNVDPFVSNWWENMTSHKICKFGSQKKNAITWRKKKKAEKHNKRVEIFSEQKRKKYV